MTITYTNRHGIPDALADAIRRDEKSSAGQLSVTQLLAPPRIRRLLEQHDTEVDVSERLWAMIGKGVHAVLERSGKSAEIQLLAKVDDIWVSGTIDATDDDVCRDWKVTSVRGGTQRKSWEQQLNLYSFLMQRATMRIESRSATRETSTFRAWNPVIPKALEVTAIYRDWVSARAGQGDYPPAATQNIPIPQWSVEEAERFLRERLALHLAANDIRRPDFPPMCTAEERWHRPDEFVVRKNGGKRALRVLGSHDEARIWVEMKSLPGLVIERREGVDVRCAGYCPARSVCPHGIAIAAAAQQIDSPPSEIETSET